MFGFTSTLMKVNVPELFNCFGMIVSVFISSDAPVFRTNRVDIAAFEGEKVILNCDADGFPHPQLIWTCDGTRMRGTTNHLLIDQIKRSIRCNCTANNYLHSATKEFNILVDVLSTTVPPAAMSTPEAAPLSGTAHLCFLHFHLYSFYTKNKND